MENFIEIINLEFRYPGTDRQNPVLKNINLNIKKGEFVSIIGPNGCGKSTLIRHFNGLLLPSSGAIRVNGLSTLEPDNLIPIRRNVGMVFQNPDNQLFASVVLEDVAFGVENMCLPRQEIKERVEKALSRVGMLEYGNFAPHRLSGGQRQKVAIAGILAMEPECIILDEPTSMLDPKGSREVMEAVRNLNSQNGITVIYVTHDMTETLYSGRLIALAEGEVVFDSSPQEFFAKPEHPDRAGVTVPPIKELANRLTYQGIKVPPDIKSAEELVDVLCQLNSKK